MSDADSFIQEVTEEVRRDRMIGLWRKYAPFVIGGLVAVVAVTAVMAWLDHAREQAAREVGGRLLEAAQGPDSAGGLLVAADALDPAPAGLARLRAAAALAAGGESGAAATLYRQIAENAEIDPALAEFAAFRAAALAAPDAGPEQTERAMTQLAGEGSAFRLLALEARAAARMRAGDFDGARADLETAASDPAATRALRERLDALAAALDARDGGA